MFRLINRLRESYWFWPSVMTLAAIVLGFSLPLLDEVIGTEWTEAVFFIRASGADGARAILTTLAGAILGVGGVVFSITIVAVSFASSNYGPRLIGNFMADRVNQLVLGIFVATFTYCVTVLTTVRNQGTIGDVDIARFVPQLSIYFSLVLAIVCIASLIAYIHHIPESINIMNLMEKVGARLRNSIITMLDEEDERQRSFADEVDIASWEGGSGGAEAAIVRAPKPGYLQQFDLTQLNVVARQHGIQISLERAPGDFLAAREMLMTVRPAGKVDDALLGALGNCYTLGAARTAVQDVLFLSDQLVEVLARALSPGVNDPHTAMLCLDWLRAALATFARRLPSQPRGSREAVLYSRVTFETMLNRSFDRMRQYVAADRTVTLCALGALADIGVVASREEMVDACRRQMRRLAQSAMELQHESLAREEIEARLAETLDLLEHRRAFEMGTLHHTDTG